MEVRNKVFKKSYSITVDNGILHVMSKSIIRKCKIKNNVEKIGNSWFYTKNGHISSNYTGFGDNQYGTWYCRNRKLDYSATTVADGKNSRWLVQNGEVNYDYTGLCQVNDRYYQVSKGNVLWEVNDSSRMQLKSYYQEEIKYGREDLSETMKKSL